jgi:hypothetical protein
MNNQTNQSGMTMHIVLFVVALVAAVIGVSAYAYYSLSGNSSPTSVPYTNVQMQNQIDAAATISPSTDNASIEAELNATSEGAIESDLNEIDSSANSL